MSVLPAILAVHYRRFDLQLVRLLPFVPLQERHSTGCFSNKTQLLARSFMMVVQVAPLSICTVIAQKSQTDPWLSFSV